MQHHFGKWGSSWRQRREGLQSPQSSKRGGNQVKGICRITSAIKGNWRWDDGDAQGWMAIEKNRRFSQYLLSLFWMHTFFEGEASWKYFVSSKHYSLFLSLCQQIWRLGVGGRLVHSLIARTTTLYLQRRIIFVSSYPRKETHCWGWKTASPLRQKKTAAAVTRKDPAQRRKLLDLHCGEGFLADKASACPCHSGKNAVAPEKSLSNSRTTSHSTEEGV